MGLSSAYLLLYPVSLYFVLTARSAGSAYLEFLARARPGEEKRPFRARFKAYYEFGKTLIDKVAVMSGKEDLFDRDHSAGTILKKIMDDGKGGLLISAHVGNWEMAGFLMKRYQGKVSIVMLDAERAEIRRVMESSMLQKEFEVIGLGQDLSHLFKIRKAFEDGRMVCIHGDRAMPGSRTAEHLFLGKKAHFPLGPFAIAAAFDVPVCFSFVVRTGDRQYAFKATPPLPADRDPLVHLERFVGALEETVREFPYQWSNFYDFWQNVPDLPHKRS
ncbi:MAG: hypothetical protein KDB88_01370 [Flavobacteriales bacterium]|nr:hypothetical protein [Flavobacteriales bacterium]